MSSSTTDRLTTRAKFERLVRDFRDATLITVTPEGPHGRPMLVAGVDAGPILWFITRFDSVKVAELSADDRALAVMNGNNRYLCVRGQVGLVDDDHLARRLWSEQQRVWFEGPTDPQLVLLRFRPEFAEYWDQSGAQGIKFVVQAARAYLTRTPLGDRQGPNQHAKLRM